MVLLCLFDFQQPQWLKYALDMMTKGFGILWNEIGMMNHGIMWKGIIYVSLPVSTTESKVLMIE